jgi:general stress protein 26
MAQQTDDRKLFTRTEAIEKLRDLIKDIDFCMLTTVDEDGTLRSRPMSTQDAEFDGDLWFFTYDPSPKAQEVRNERQVNVSYADIGAHTYVSVSGTATLVHDRAKMEQYWHPAHKIYFPDGLETPGLALLKVEVSKAEYWESDGKVATLLEMAKSVVTGSEFEGGDNQKLTL